MFSTYSRITANNSNTRCIDHSTGNNNTHWMDLENDNSSSLSLKPTSNLELLINQYNKATLENTNNPDKFAHPHVMRLRKCLTLKYLTKINRPPCFISMHVLLI